MGTLHHGPWAEEIQRDPETRRPSRRPWAAVLLGVGVGLLLARRLK